MDTNKEEVFNLKLIHEVKKQPVLYNFRLADYNKREAVEAGWENVAKAMNDSVQNCKAKWRNIRTVLTRKLKTPVKGSKRSKVKPYYLIDSLKFLIPFISTHKRDAIVQSPADESQPIIEQETLKQEDDEEEEEEALISDDGQQQLHQESLGIEPEEEYELGQFPKKRKEITPNDGDFIKYNIEKRNRRCDEDDARRMFLLSLLPDIEKLSDIKMRKFRRGVLDILDSLLDEQPFSY